MRDLPADGRSEEYRAIRAAVRAVCDAKVAPNAAEVDESGRVPAGVATTRCVAADFHAPHIPEEYGGAGADALATCIVIEEVARACASSSLIPAVNKLGTLPMHPGRVGGPEGGLPVAGRGGRRGCSPTRCPSRRPARTPVSMRTRAVRDGDGYVLNGVKRWITNAGVSEYYTVFAVTDPDAAGATASRRSWSRGPTTASPSAHRSRSSGSRGRRPVRSTSTTSGSPPSG